MKVSKLISDLQELNPDDEIVIGYWDKSIADSYIADENKPLTNDQWIEIVDEIGLENIQFEEIGELIQQLAYEKTELLEGDQS
jgi:hypothetical protein